MSASIDDWREFLSEAFPKNKLLVEGLLIHIEVMERNGVPPVFENRHFRQILGLTGLEFGALMADRNYRYRSFDIPKRSGGTRSISSPIPALYYVQKWILDNILMKGYIHPNAHGGISEKSIITNAKQHVSQRCILKLDIVDFYGNIKIGKGISIFRQFGYSPEVSLSLARLCFKDGTLPQGAATSPQLANLTSAIMDERLSKLGQKYGLTYSRYFDDLTFSGDFINLRLEKIVAEIVHDTGFDLNKKKTRLLRGRSAKYVTGLLVNDETVRLPKDTRRDYRNQAVLLLKHGVDAQTNLSRDPLFLERVLGRLAFWRQVEQDCDIARNLFEGVLELCRSSLAPIDLPEPYRPKPIPAPLDPAPKSN